MNYQKLYQDIMDLDRNIRMVTICDTDGKIMHSDHRPGVTNQLTQKIGRGKYVLAEYEKIKRITMPLGERHLVYVTTELQANHDSIISGITSFAPNLANSL